MKPVAPSAVRALALSCAVIGSAASADEPDAGAAPVADPAEAWLAHARSCLTGKFSLEAEFIHEVLHPLGGAQPTSKGTVQLRRGGRLRLEYTAPDRRVLVANGKQIKAYDPETRTLYQSPARGGVLPLAFGFALEPKRVGRFEARWIGGGAAPTGTDPAVIELVPKKRDPLVAKVLLTLAPGCPVVRRVTIIDRAGVAVRVTLANPRFNVGIGARRFELVPPPGTTVVTP